MKKSTRMTKATFDLRLEKDPLSGGIRVTPDAGTRWHRLLILKLKENCLSVQMNETFTNKKIIHSVILDNGHSQNNFINKCGNTKNENGEITTLRIFRFGEPPVKFISDFLKKYDRNRYEYVLEVFTIPEPATERDKVGIITGLTGGEFRRIFDD